MPTSNLALAPAILNLVATAPAHATILDVGPGHGKYAVLVREYVGPVERLDAVEAWEPYVEAFKLRDLYDEVIVEDVRFLGDADLARYDVVLMVDVLEHLEHVDGEALLRRIAGRVIVCTPASFFQNPEHLAIPPEAHRSVWTLEELAAIRPLEVGYVELGGVIARLAPADA